MQGTKLYEVVSLKIRDKDSDNCYSIEESDLHKKTKGVFKNFIRMRENELIRILLALDASINTNDKYPFIGSLIVMNIGRSVKEYYDDSNTQDIRMLDKITFNGIPFLRLMTGSGNVRNKKALYIRSDLFEKANRILLCGMQFDMAFKKMCKFNSYYGLASTDSKPVSTPKIVVIDDFEKKVKENYDFVVNNGIDQFCLQPPICKEEKIQPFDGAGLVSIEKAALWATELGLDYIPSSFQIRALPGIKGNLFVFDIRSFAKEHKSTLIDYENNTWDLFDDNIDCILTKSQFKFGSQYNNDRRNFEEWSKAFSQELYGYKPTWNISEYAENPNELKNHAVTSYQHLQTLPDMNNEEIKELCAYTVKLIERLSTDADEFLRFRGLTELDEETGEITNRENEYTPPYYEGLKVNHSLMFDNYVQGKMKDDLREMKRRSYAGKILISGNYQVFTPDLYGLAQYAFGLEVTGLLPAYSVYSAYWIKKSVDKVDIIRNPHIAQEHRIAKVDCNEDMLRWFKYQSTGIVTSLYDSIPMALNGADFDGDHVMTSSSNVLIKAVERNKTNTIVNQNHREDEMERQEKSKPIPKINDIRELMRIDALGMKNDIGSCINKISVLWSLSQTDQTQKYVKIMSVIGSLIIDAVKHGTFPKIPDDIKSFLSGKKKPYFMLFTKKSRKELNKYKRSLKLCELKGLSEDEAKKLSEYSNSDCTMNRICHYMQSQVEKIEMDFTCAAKDDLGGNKFDFTTLLKKNGNCYNLTYSRIKEKLLEVQNLQNIINNSIYHEPDSGNDGRNDNSMKYQIFYDACRVELLKLCPDVDSLLDHVLYVYYCDKDFVKKYHDKSILWNCFKREMVDRCQGKTSNKIFNADVLEKRSKKLNKKVKQSVSDAKRVSIKSLEGMATIIYNSEINTIRKMYSRDINRQKLLFVLYAINKMSGDTFKVESNKKGVISNSQICKLCGISWYTYDQSIKQMYQDCSIDIDIKGFYRVLIDEQQQGKAYEISDINKSRELANMLFRYEGKRNSENSGQSIAI